MTEEFARWLGTLGPWAVFGLAFIGPYLFPAAGEVAIVGAIGLGEPLMGVLVLATTGAMASDHVAYGIGRFGIGGVVERRLSPSVRARMAERIEQHATLVLVPGRLLTGARTWAAIIAGAVRFPYARFTALNLLGCLLWAVTFVIIAVPFAAAVDVPQLVDFALRWFWVVALVLIALALLRRQLLRSRTPSA